MKEALHSNRAAFCCGAWVSSCAGFGMPGCRDPAQRRMARVRKAPRHEIVGL